MMESQSLGPDRFSARARDARGRFARGSSGNPRGRPPGIPNPKRRVPDLVARPLSAQALSHLLDRKPYLLRPLAAQLLPPPLRAIDPAERLGIDNQKQKPVILHLAARDRRPGEEAQGMDREGQSIAFMSVKSGDPAPCRGASVLGGVAVGVARTAENNGGTTCLSGPTRSTLA
jgi:hypothetical protein